MDSILRKFRYWSSRPRVCDADALPLWRLWDIWDRSAHRGRWRQDSALENTGAASAFAAGMILASMALRPHNHQPL